MTYKCPYCQHEGPPRIEKKMSSNGWILFIVLLMLCFPLCWIPFVMDDMKEEKRRCMSCGTPH